MLAGVAAWLGVAAWRPTRARDCDPWCSPVRGAFLCPVIPGRCPPVRLRGYGVNVPAMSLELHEWDIHIE